MNQQVALGVLRQHGYDVPVVVSDIEAFCRVQPQAPGCFKQRLRVRLGNFADLALFAREEGFAPLAGIVLDLGLSSFQLADAARGLRAAT